MASIRGLASFLRSASGALASISDVRVQMALGEESVSVRHLWCCGTLLRGLLIRLMRFSVCVSHGSTLEPSTSLTEDARGAKAAADAGSSCGGILWRWGGRAATPAAATTTTTTRE